MDMRVDSAGGEDFLPTGDNFGARADDDAAALVGDEGDLPRLPRFEADGADVQALALGGGLVEGRGPGWFPGNDSGCQPGRGDRRCWRR